MDAVFDIADENQRLRERAAELEARMKSLLEDAQATSDLDDEAHRLLDFALGEGEPETTSMETVAGRLPRLIAERDAALAQVAVLREALERELPEVPRPHVLEVADAQAASMEEVRVRHINKVRERILSTLASTPAPEHDYSGLCAAPSCEGHCGYVHARGCEAVREYLADHGGKPYRAPRKEATRG